MKNKLAQLYILVSKIDRRHIQLAYFAFVLAGLALLPQAPTDGGGGPI
jgi:hypothetical protein